MKAITNILFLIILAALGSCQSSHKPSIPSAEGSFLPMQVGNLWKIGEQNYTTIQDTLKIDGERYFKFYSLVGGDAVDIKYLRINGANELLEAYPDQPKKTYIHAKFNGKVGDEFYTLGDQSTNDYKVKLIEKTAERMTFEFEMVFHHNLKGSKHKVSYVKGTGFDGNWKQLIINGKSIDRNNNPNL